MIQSVAIVWITLSLTLRPVVLVAAKLVAQFGKVTIVAVLFVQLRIYVRG